MSKFTEYANTAASKYGPALTKCILEGDIATMKALFVTEEPVVVVLPTAEDGSEISFTVGDQEDALIPWEELQKVMASDMSAQGYARTESECVGVLGDRFMMQTARFNKAGEIYQESFSLLTLNADGKITMLESFSDVNAEGLMSTASGATKA